MIRNGALALAAIAATCVIVPPLPNLAEQLFSAHMAQHLLLIAVVAPLLAFSGALEPARAAPVLRSLLHPVTAWLCFVIVFLLWHWPPAFHWAAGAEPTRLLELGSIFVAATAFWLAALAPANKTSLSFGARALYVMTAAVATDLPGVIMVFAPQAICNMPHENAARFGLSPLQDQEIAGLLMWVPANLVFFGIATGLFARWISDPAPERSAQQKPVVS